MSMNEKEIEIFYFAYDTKYKIMVEVDTGLNIIQKIPKKFNTIGG